MSVLIRAKS